MVMGAFIPGLRRKYPAHEYISALLLVIGLILFTLADANSSPNFNVIGIVMIVSALVMDSFLGNFQEAIFTTSPETTQVYIYIISRCGLARCGSDNKTVNWNCVFCFNFTQMEMLFCSTIVGMPFLLAPMIFTGELFRAWSSCSEVDRQTNTHCF